MNITPKHSLRDVVIDNPAAADVFEKLGIDYACRGGRVLGEVLSESGISIEEFMGEMEQAARVAIGSASGTDWRVTPLRTLIRHIVNTHHSYLRVELPALDKWISKILEQHPSERELLRTLQRAIQRLQRNVEVQMIKEEAILFPAISDLERAAVSGGPPSDMQFGSVANLSRVMGAENNAAASTLHEIRILTNNYTCPPEGSTALKTLLERLRSLAGQEHRHLHLENNILLPRAIVLEQGVTACN